MAITLFRCDSSLLIGSGHVYRCLSLARSLSARGARIVFACRDHKENLIDVIRSEFEVLTLKHSNSSGSSVDSDSEVCYKSWLNCSEIEDADETFYALSRAGITSPSTIVIDHYGISREWEERIRSHYIDDGQQTPALIAIDDLANRKHAVDILVDATRATNSEKSRYSSLVPKDCRLMLGPYYALLDSIYCRLRPIVPHRQRLGNILVFFGGIDAANYTSVALRALKIEEMHNVSVDIILGKRARHLKEVQNLVQGNQQFSVHVGLASLAGLIVRADLAIGAAGTTSWERACLGLPTIICPVADNQAQTSKEICNAGAGILVNEKEKKELERRIKEEVRNILHNQGSISSMSKRCAALGDGYGTHRLTSVILGTRKEIFAREATLPDMYLYYQWANDKEVREQSFNKRGFSIESHINWFSKRVDSDLFIMLVFVDIEGLPVGQIRFERSGSHVKQATIAFSIDEVHRGQGLGAKVLELGCDEMFKRWGLDNEAYGEVLEDNIPSRKAFIKAGFDELSQTSKGVRRFVKRVAPSNND